MSTPDRTEQARCLLADALDLLDQGLAASAAGNARLAADMLEGAPTVTTTLEETRP